MNVDLLKLKIETAARRAAGADSRLADAIAHHATSREVKALRAQLAAARRSLRRAQDLLAQAMRAGR
jgi:5-bromo-4-chloroindolyl phosphate hydrolysis protein